MVVVSPTITRAIAIYPLLNRGSIHHSFQAQWKVGPRVQADTDIVVVPASDGAVPIHRGPAAIPEAIYLRKAEVYFRMPYLLAHESIEVLVAHVSHFYYAARWVKRLLALIPAGPVRVR